jgi:hypothetical protein
MFSKKIIQLIIVGIVCVTCFGQALGGTFILRSSTNCGHHIAQTVKPGFHRRPFHKKHILKHFHHRSFLKRRPHPHKIVVVRRPWRRQIAINLVPTVTVTKSQIVVEPTMVTVWITNSNRSQTSVNLRKSGPGYVGPRGEYYHNMPTEEQLRIVYGF